MPDLYKGLEEEWDQANKILEQSDFIIFPGPICMDNRSGDWPIDRGINDFLLVARKLEKKIIYFSKQSFSLDNIQDLLSTISINVEINYPLGNTNSDPAEPIISIGRKDPEIYEFIKSAANYTGRPLQFLVEWINDGIVHSYWRIADWYLNLLDEVLLLRPIIEQRAHEEESNKEAEMLKITRQIAEDRVFQSRPNRRLRVEVIKGRFSDLKSQEAYQIEQEAFLIFQEEILPEREKEIVRDANKRLKSGDSLTSVAHKLDMSRGKLQRLISKYND